MTENPDVGEEARQLTLAALRWARGAIAAAEAGHAAGSASECAVCPLCKAIRAVRDADPETERRWADAATRVAGTVVAALRAVAPHHGHGAPAPGDVDVHRITVDD